VQIPQGAVEHMCRQQIPCIETGNLCIGEGSVHL